MKHFCGVQKKEVNTCEVVFTQKRMHMRKKRRRKRKKKIEAAKVIEKGKRWCEKKHLAVEMVEK